MGIVFSAEHLEEFQKKAMVGVWDEQEPAAWVKSVGIPALSSSFSQQKMTRSFLKQSSSDERITDRDLLWGILAWGKMRRDAARRFAQYEGSWLKVIKALRTENLNRSDSYSLCAETVARNPSGGIGPAYYTKLIFFANPRHDGYIMDQWTSRSVNLLVSGDPIVAMRTSNHVSPQNSAETYETYCRIVETLSKLLIDKNPEETESCLFSTGGRLPAAWRRYVIQNG
jgi:hypothetical protein